MSAVFGVGIIGAGPVTQAIHLPTLARLRHTFRVVHVMDVDAEIASTVAARVGARSSTSIEAVMADDDVDIVAICSPPQFHAQQVESAIAAKKKAILCEKPFAVSHDEAVHLAAISRASGVPIVVGAMHAFDQGWTAVADQATELSDTVTAIRSSIVLPLNSRYEDWSTQIHGRPAGGPGGGELDQEARAAMLRNAVLGLTVHDLPLIRQVVPEITDVIRAEFIPPFGYQITLRAGDVVLDLFGYMHLLWRPDWTLEMWGPEKSIAIEFTPSYVHAGSATAAVSGDDKTELFGPYQRNGYDSEWRHVGELAAGRRQAPADLDAVIDDLTYTIDIADRVQAFAKGESND
jgi:myo-inositol 2-dehydrogenase / D-chiro-inositol 1-dehydrogenase